MANFGTHEDIYQHVQEDYREIFTNNGQPTWVDLAAQRDDILALGLQMKLLIESHFTDGLESICRQVLGDFKRLREDNPNNPARKWTRSLQALFEALLILVWTETLTSVEAGQKTADFVCENYDWAESKTLDFFLKSNNISLAAYRARLEDRRKKKSMIACAENELSLIHI